MSGLVKATLQKLRNDTGDATVGNPVPVQFNPASLRLTISNNTEGGQNTARSQRQFTGNASTEVAFDLVFDTSDEVENGGPKSVRRKTSMVEQYVLAQGTGQERKSPPRVKFVWGGLVVKGVITSVTLDFDHFAPDGTPLRAKMGVSIREQDALVELLQRGSGSSTAGGAPPPGEGNGNGPGGQGGGPGDPSANRTAAALEGESAAEFAVRVGLDAGAWRGLAAGLDGTLSLEAGLEIDFNASLEASFGVGLSVGIEADLGISLEASLGLEAGVSLSAGVSAGASASASAGFALSAAGGVTAAVETVKIAKAEAAAAATVQAFGAPVTPSAATVVSAGGSAAVSGAAAAVKLSAGAASGASSGTSATAAAAVATGGAGAAGGTAAASARGGASAASGSVGSTAAASAVGASAPRAYAPPRADPRATSFGFGVPLRPRVTGAADTSQGVVALRPYGPSREVPVTRDPTVPGWTQLPAPKPGWSQAEGATPAGRARVDCAGAVIRTTGGAATPGGFPSSGGTTRSAAPGTPATPQPTANRGTRSNPCGCGGRR